MAKKRSKIRHKPISKVGTTDQEVGWASIPGERLDVDIAATDETTNAAAATPTDDGNGEFDADKWASQHYDEESDDGGNDHAGDLDLFDPDPIAKTNKYDAGSKLEGANDAGMFLR